MVQKKVTVFFFLSDDKKEIYKVLTDAVLCFTKFRYDRHKFENIIENDDCRLFDDKENHTCVIFRSGSMTGAYEAIAKYSVSVELVYECTEFLSDSNFLNGPLL